MTDIAELRAFNRFYTRQIGLLDEHITRSPYSLQEGRLIYELASRGRTSGAELARAMDVDPAYVSRLLQRLVSDGLVAITPSATDRRRNELSLTAKGEAAFEQLDTSSDAAIASLLEPLDGRERTRLVTASRTMRKLLGENLDAGPITLRPHRIGELGWLIHRQGLIYHQQFGWNGEFESLIARIYHEYEAAPANPPKALWVAEQGGEIAGSVFVVPSEGRPGTAQLRMLYVEPDARGLGLGTTLVEQAVSFAREAGYRRMRLWTQSTLVSARRIYEAAGFRITESNPHHSFGVDLVGEHWELELARPQ